MPTEAAQQIAKELVDISNNYNASSLYLVLSFTVAAVCGLIWVMWFIMGIKFKPVDKLEEKLEKLQDTLQELNSKIWTEENLDNKIENKINHALQEHVRTYHDK